MAEIKRPQRASINGTRNRLRVRGLEPGYSYRIVHDIDDRIAILQERGYEFVENKGITVGDKRVATPTPTGTNVEISLGQGAKGYLMRLKDEYKQEDDKAKAAQIDQSEASLHNPNIDGRYGKLDIKRA